MKRESPARTLLVATGVALVCSVMVSSAVYWLRPIQSAYAAVERNRVIIEAAGLVAPDAILSESEIVDQFLDLEVRLVDLRSASYSTAADPLRYDPITAAQDASTSTELPAERDPANIGRRAHYSPVYLRMLDGQIQRMVLPIYGGGMWSEIHAFISLGSDVNTITGIFFTEHGETPGVGDRIDDPAWRSRWIGKQIYDADGELRFHIAPGVAAGESEDYRVDAISGATVTVDAVENIMRFWFGEDGFGPLLKRLQPSQ